MSGIWPESFYRVTVNNSTTILILFTFERDAFHFLSEGINRTHTAICCVRFSFVGFIRRHSEESA